MGERKESGRGKHRLEKGQNLRLKVEVHTTEWARLGAIAPILGLGSVHIHDRSNAAKGATTIWNRLKLEERLATRSSRATRSRSTRTCLLIRRKGRIFDPQEPRDPDKSTTRNRRKLSRGRRLGFAWGITVSFSLVMDWLLRNRRMQVDAIWR